MDIKELTNEQLIMFALYKLLNDLAFDEETSKIKDELTLRVGV